jgi:hypothetical protein
MEGDNIKTHHEEMAKVFERLEALSDPVFPLLADNFYVPSIITSPSPDWMPCVFSLPNKPHVPLHSVVAALKQEGLQRKAQVENLQAPDLGSRTNISSLN